MKIALENKKIMNNFLQQINTATKEHFQSFYKQIQGSDLVQFILNWIKHECECNCKYELQISDHKHSNQKVILENQIEKLNTQIQIQRERTANFIKQFTKNRILQELTSNNLNIQTKINDNKVKNKNKMSLYQTVLVNYSPKKQLNYLSSSIQMVKSSITDQTTCSPQAKNKISQSQSLQNSQVKTSKFKIYPLQVSVQNSQQKHLIQRPKRAISGGKLFDKLRKLQCIMFQDSNKENKKNLQQAIWNAGISPEKQIIKEQNKNLKCIQSNLVTHLEILQKYKFIPEADKLIQREQRVKLKQKQLRMMEDNLITRQIQINKKHSQILTKQKSFFLY